MGDPAVGEHPRGLPALPTGLTDLDRQTGGGTAGATWIVAGPPGTPSSLLALTVARATGLIAELPVRWLSTWEKTEELTASVVAAEGPATFGFLDSPRDAHERDRADRARAQLLASDLRFAQVQPADLLDEAERLLRDAPPALLILDEIPDLYDDRLSRLRQKCALTGTWLLLVAAAMAQEADAEGAGSDMLVWCEHADDESDRCGEADLAVYTPGQEPAMVTVAFQAHLRRHVNVWVTPPYA